MGRRGRGALGAIAWFRGGRMWCRDIAERPAAVGGFYLDHPINDVFLVLELNRMVESPPSPSYFP